MEVELSGSERAGKAVEDQRTLLADHILPWIYSWLYGMQKYARTDFFRGVGKYVFGLVKAYAARFGYAFSQSGEPSYWVMGR